jgi:hypothetical protein
MIVQRDVCGTFYGIAIGRQANGGAAEKQKFYVRGSATLSNRSREQLPAPWFLCV